MDVHCSMKWMKCFIGMASLSITELSLAWMWKRRVPSFSPFQERKSLRRFNVLPRIPVFIFIGILWPTFGHSFNFFLPVFLCRDMLSVHTGRTWNKSLQNLFLFQCVYYHGMLIRSTLNAKNNFHFPDPFLGLWRFTSFQMLICALFYFGSVRYSPESC